MTTVVISVCVVVTVGALVFVHWSFRRSTQPPQVPLVEIAATEAEVARASRPLHDLDHPPHRYVRVADLAHRISSEQVWPS